jgi:hypothetical protein
MNIHDFSKQLKTCSLSVKLDINTKNSLDINNYLTTQDITYISNQISQIKAKKE